MTPETKHHLFVGGAVIAAGIAAVWLYHEISATAAAAASSGSQPDTANSEEAMLEEMALAGGSAPVNYSAPADQSLESPNFAADLEAAVQQFQALGLLPSPPAPAQTPTPVTPVGQPTVPAHVVVGGGGGGGGGIIERDTSGYPDPFPGADSLGPFDGNYPELRRPVE